MRDKHRRCEHTTRANIWIWLSAPFKESSPPTDNSFQVWKSSPLINFGPTLVPRKLNSNSRDVFSVVVNWKRRREPQEHRGSGQISETAVVVVIGEWTAPVSKLHTTVSPEPRSSVCKWYQKLGAKSKSTRSEWHSIWVQHCAHESENCWELFTIYLNGVLFWVCICWRQLVPSHTDDCTVERVVCTFDSEGSS